MPATSVPNWRKSTFSGDGGTGGGNCVEAAVLVANRFALRDSKNPGAVLDFPRPGLRALTRLCIVYDVRRGDE
jgi:Domain of unknown function (DUF397)